VLLERGEGHGAEELFGRGKFGQQPLKVAGSFEPAAEFIREHRLGRARRSDEQDMMAGEQRGEQPVNDLRPLEEDLTELLPQAPEAIASAHARDAKGCWRGIQVRSGCAAASLPSLPLSRCLR